MKRRPAPPDPPLRVSVQLEDYQDTAAAADLFRAIRKAQALTATDLEKEREDEPEQRSEN